MMQSLKALPKNDPIQDDIRYLTVKVVNMEQMIADLMRMNHELHIIVKTAVQPKIEYITRGQAASILNVDERTVDRWCRDGKLHKNEKGLVRYADVEGV